MEKKTIIIIFLSILTIGMGIFNVFLIPYIPPPIKLDLGSTLFVGTASGPYTLDPIDSWDIDSNAVLEQVVETLFFYDLNDLDLPRINLLAESYFWENLTTLHIKIREGVRFHDNTPFNAEAARWNLHRLLYLTNSYGNNTGEIAHTRSLWLLSDKETPIIKHIKIVGEYNITITLNAPFAPLLNILAYINAGMISPTAHANYENNLIHLQTEKLIGTGPYTFSRHTLGKEVVLSRWEGYWRNLAIFKKVKFLVYEEMDDLTNAMLSHQIDCFSLPQYASYVLPFENISSIIIKNFTEDTGKSSLAYIYLGINNEQYNITWRKALFYAINYSYIIKEIRKEDCLRSNSPISPGFGLTFNESTQAPNYNITKAREIMVSMGFGNMSWSDSEWTSVAQSSSPFRTVPYQYYRYFLNSFRESLGNALIEWFKLIGVSSYFDDLIPFEPWMPWEPLLHIFQSGWGPDYLDPYNMLEPLFNPLSSGNLAKINDTTLTAMMQQALETIDDSARNQIYKNIQSYNAEGFFRAPLYHPKLYFIHSADIYGIPYNAMGKFQAYGMRRG